MDNSKQTSDIDCKAKSLWTETMLCVWWVQKDVIYYELLKPGEKPLILNATGNHWWIWTKHCVKNDQNIKGGNTKWFCFLIMHHRTQQNRSRKRWRRLVCKYFRMRLTHQTWLHPITTYLHRWDTHLRSSASLLTKMHENSLMIGLSQKRSSFWLGIHKSLERWEKYSDGQYFE